MDGWDAPSLRLPQDGPDAPTEAWEIAIAHAMLRLASQGRLHVAARVHTPARPVVVFGRRDTRLPGFAGAVREADAAGFDTAVRAVGGRAVAYTEKAVVVDYVSREHGAVGAMESRFATYGSRMATALRELDIDARVGAVPGEFCPGAHSVNARGVVKLIGTAQRVVRDAWLFSSLVVVGDEDRVRAVLTDVYGHLQLPFDPASVGSVTGENPDLTIDQVQRVVRRAWRIHGSVPTDVAESVLAEARSLSKEHLTSVPAPGGVRPRGGDG